MKKVKEFLVCALVALSLSAIGMSCVSCDGTAFNVGNESTMKSSVDGGSTGDVSTSESIETDSASDVSTSVSGAVWACTFEQFEDYMSQLGYFTKGDYKEMSTIGTISRIYNGIDVMWWDVDNLKEETLPYKYWNEFQEKGYTLDFGNTVYAPQFNGPFAINATSVFSGDKRKLYDDFIKFPNNYTPSEKE